MYALPSMHWRELCKVLCTDSLCYAMHLFTGPHRYLPACVPPCVRSFIHRLQAMSKAALEKKIAEDKKKEEERLKKGGASEKEHVFERIPSHQV